MKPKILLVDDREDNLLSIETVLAPDGYQFYKATSGREALKILLEETDFAIILMDVKMPILNGFETASLIYEREKLKHIPIIFVTANNYGDENVFRGYQAGGIDYLLKPINPEVLRAKVSVFVNLYMKSRLLIEQEQKLIAVNKILGNEINDRKVSEEKLKLLNTKLQEKLTALTTGTPGQKHLKPDSIHTLKDSIGEILEACDKLLSQKPSPEDAKHLTKIKKSATHAQQIITGVLTSSVVSIEH